MFPVKPFFFQFIFQNYLKVLLNTIFDAECPQVTLPITHLYCLQRQNFLCNNILVGSRSITKLSAIYNVKLYTRSQRGIRFYLRLNLFIAHVKVQFYFIIHKLDWEKSRQNTALILTNMGGVNLYSCGCIILLPCRLYIVNFVIGFSANNTKVLLFKFIIVSVISLSWNLTVWCSWILTINWHFYYNIIWSKQKFVRCCEK